MAMIVVCIIKDTSLCPFLVHDTVATLSAADRILWTNLILAVAL